MSGRVNQVYELPVWETITSAWDKVAGTKGSFWAGIGILFAIMFGIGILESLTENTPGISVVISFVGNLVGYFCQVGLIYMGIRRAKGEEINFKMMFYAFDLQLALMLIALYVLQIVIFMIPAIIGLVGGLLIANGGALAVIGGLLMIPAVIIAIILAIRLSIAMAFVLDAGAAPVEALKSSMKASTGNFWNLLGVFLLQTIIITISAIPLGIGLIWTLPLCFICYGLIYQRLRVNV